MTPLIRKIVNILPYSVWFVLIFALAVASQNQAPLRFASSTRTAILAVTPEGWGFFTRDAREQDLIVYRVEADGQLVIANGVGARLSQFFGFRREDRYRAAEISALLGAVPVKRWSECKGALRDCLTSATRSTREGHTGLFQIENGTANAAFCGRFVAQKVDPVPWAWCRSAVSMPSTFVEVAVKCG